MQRAAYNRAMDTGHQRRINQIMAEKYGMKSAFQEAIEGALGLSSALSLAGGAMAAVMGIRKVVGDVASAFGDAKRAAEDMAKGSLDTLLAMREIATLRDKPAPDLAELARLAGARKASGLSREEAVTVSEMLADTMGTVSIEKVPEKERGRLETYVAQMVARSGGSKVARPLSDRKSVV